MTIWILSIAFVILLGLFYSLYSKHKKLMYQYEEVVYKYKDLERKLYKYEFTLAEIYRKLDDPYEELDEICRNHDQSKTVKIDYPKFEVIVRKLQSTKDYIMRRFKNET